VITTEFVGFLRRNDSHLEREFTADNEEDLKRGSQMGMGAMGRLP